MRTTVFSGPTANNVLFMRSLVHPWQPRSMISEIEAHFSNYKAISLLNSALAKYLDLPVSRRSTLTSAIHFLSPLANHHILPQSCPRLLIVLCPLRWISSRQFSDWIAYTSNRHQSFEPHVMVRPRIVFIIGRSEHKRSKIRVFNSVTGSSVD